MPSRYNNAVEGLRDKEYPMMKDNVYLDHAGTTVYSKSLMEQFSREMMSNLYGNPHSASAPAHLSGQMVDGIREKALRFFEADPEEFDLIFTANATSAIKIVAESFRDIATSSSTGGTFQYAYHRDSHTSLIGVREMTDNKSYCFKDDFEVEQWLNGERQLFCSDKYVSLGLFAYPGQSNMTGRRLPLSWISRLCNSKLEAHQQFFSLLDAAALATTTQLDFSDSSIAPDFTAVSFYKIFGFPDLGALIVKKQSGDILQWRRYFGGGTVDLLTVLHDPVVKRRTSSIHEALEDGTLPFHNILALGCAMDTHKKLFGSMELVSKHVSYLYHRLHVAISCLHHSNGRPLCKIYNEVSNSISARTQGGTIAFNIVSSDGSPISHSEVETLANSKHIYLRSGGLCNPGGITTYLKIEPWQFRRAWAAGFRCGSRGFEIIRGRPTGVVRASLGAMSTIADVDALVYFLHQTFIDDVKPPSVLPTSSQHTAQSLTSGTTGLTPEQKTTLRKTLGLKFKASKRRLKESVIGHDTQNRVDEGIAFTTIQL